MKRLAILLPLILAACGARVVQPPTVEFPVLPDLSAETAKACPPAALVTGSLGDLAAKDAGLAIEYARCQARAAAAVGAYQTAQRLMAAAQAMAEKQEQAAKGR